MAKITIQNLEFTYDGFYEPIFTGLSCDIDTTWKLGLLGRNGMGKTTLLRLMQGCFEYAGVISSPVSFDYFPFPVDMNETTRHILREAIAPFAAMEAEMERCLQQVEADEQALSRYGELQERYQLLDGYIIDELIEAEIGRLGVTVGVLERPFGSLSGGERTKLMLAALFLKKDNFLLIDEPTDHLDMAGRQAVADYLRQKQGFILVSHDRRFLDTIIDHVMVLEKERLILRQGSFSAYLEDKEREDAFELEKNERLAQQIEALERSARQKTVWSDRIEATKIGGGRSIGATSATKRPR